MLQTTVTENANRSAILMSIAATACKRDNHPYCKVTSDYYCLCKQPND